MVTLLIILTALAALLAFMGICDWALNRWRSSTSIPNPYPTEGSIAEGTGYALEGFPVNHLNEESGSAVSAIQHELPIESAAATEAASTVLEAGQAVIHQSAEAISGLMEGL
ncbi:hypothetical protein IQ266_26450 [filamentous cyanobacterium LEGE 11480]|uniref:Uncharacterized protein n=1 Tax=Romeriopsis navalis LEGE 11480 TaxID=2777977 RepID=A0A928VVD6_9CYAN|nr:hypothetical protein [Romeriopsis navalis]MBE9033280.1 hypothetical protein [Romeriopsis navalis LEGE 11480]